MASASNARPKKGLAILQPHYIGVTKTKNAKGVEKSSTHYVLIEKRVASQLGIKAIVKKPGGSDIVEQNIVYQTNRKKGKGTGNVEAKRHIQQCKHAITLYCKGMVKNKAGKLVHESYSVGFPSGVPLSVIKEFLRKNCPNVVRYGTGSQLYQV